MIVLDYQDRRPIYEQVTDKFQFLSVESCVSAFLYQCCEFFSVALSVYLLYLRAVCYEISSAFYRIQQRGTGENACGNL